MEHTARLAVIEKNAKSSSNFGQILDALLETVERVLGTRREPLLRRVCVRAGPLQPALDVDGTLDYLKHIGFLLENNYLVYPVEKDLNCLKEAKDAIKRKLNFLTGGRSKPSGARHKIIASTSKVIPTAPPSYTTVLRTDNEFLRSVERTFQHVLAYEDAGALESARRCVPLVTLQLAAVERLRDRQRRIKQGSGEAEMPLELALLYELVAWFKNSFFRWMDRPACGACGETTSHLHNGTEDTGAERCRVEVYSCPRCRRRERFVRHNEPAVLLRTRVGRCGEWANCFALLCRALGYDTRYVVDTTDHVWCEVWEPAARRWVHVDPCEAAVDTPLMYEHGWGKQLEYVVAYSRDDVQDVTWRYSSRHGEVRARRRRCGEAELVAALLSLRAARHESVALSAARRAFLRRRTACELADLMLERQPGDYEQQGRTSGSAEWRARRGECGGGGGGRVWRLAAAGAHALRYWPAGDSYALESGDAGDATADTGDAARVGWREGTWSCENVQRKVEHDWKMVYLARIDGEAPGRVSWRLAAADGLRIESATVSQVSAEFEGGRVEWSVAMDDRPPETLHFQSGGAGEATVSGRCVTLTVAAALSGGAGAVGWQHAQLCRLPLHSAACGLCVRVHVVPL